MSGSPLFDAGERLGDPAGDPSREAIASLRGYTYQLYASALAWLRLGEGETLHLEVAEDYAVAAADALQGVQVRDTPAATITIRSVADTIDIFVDLVARNADRRVALRYLTTSQIGLERAQVDRVENGPTLAYWRRAAQGAPIAPLRAILLSLDLKPETIAFIEARDDAALRDDLISRMHWDAGQAPLEDLIADLEAGLVEFAVGTLRQNADIGRRMADLALASVLKVTVRRERQLRRLRRADLIEIGDSLGNVSIPRELLERLMAQSGSTPTRHAFLLPGEIVTTGPIALRTDLVSDVSAKVAEASFGVVTGSTGMGKTYVASQAAQSPDWRMADLRGVAAPAAVARLEAILGEAMVAPCSHILLDDLDCLDDPGVQRWVRRLVLAMHRRDGAVLVTCASPPSGRTIEAICGTPLTAIDVPYLSASEVSDLVAQAGGDPKLGKLIYLAGSSGHPQLVQAAILHMRAANWERGAIRALLDGDASDIAAEKRVARDRLVTAMPANARAMLYRTSLIRGRFTRELALKLADVDPTVVEPGTEIDRLIGAWIERPNRHALRVSPLVAQAGAETLSPGECVRVHQAVADHYLLPGTLSVDDIDALLHHALAGGDADQVQAFAEALVTVPSDMRAFLDRHSPRISALTTDGLIFPASAHISNMLRLGQLLVVLAGGNIERAKRAWEATKREIAEAGPRFEVVVLAKMLVETIVVDAIPEWLELLLKLDSFAQTDPGLGKVAQAMHDERGTPETPQSFAFVLQAMALRSTPRLLAAFERLDREAPEVRDRLFSGLEHGAGNYSHLVNSAWVGSVKVEGFDAEQAARDYLAMAGLAEKWRKPTLAARCHAARAIMLNEYAKAPKRAMAALEEAQARLGPMPALSRARAQVNWHQRDHENALRSFAEAWNDNTADSDDIERGFIAREAGINAAETGDWADARIWFERARDCFAQADAGMFPALRVGLIADAAQAAFKAGDAAGALASYSEALEALPSLDPESSINAGYCHRVVCHSVLWLMREARDTKIDVELAELPPGSCSNSEPNAAILSQPLPPVDLVWYMLADAALDLGYPALFEGLYGKLNGGPIIGLEVERQFRLARHVVRTGTVPWLAEALKLYGSALAYLEAEQVDMAAGDVLNPNRGPLPLHTLYGHAPAPAIRGASDLLVSFGLVRALAGDGEALRQARDALGGPDFSRVRGLAKRMVGAEGDPNALPELVAATVAEIAGAGGLPIDPAVALRATVRFTIWARNSAFRNQLAGPLGDWTARTWQEILDKHRFRLRTPGETADAIAAAIAAEGDPLARTARIALAADAAVPLIVPDNVRTALAELAAI